MYFIVMARETVITPLLEKLKFFLWG